MCGIAGIFHPGTPKPVEPARVQRMIDALAHRGPDGDGVWTAPGVGLGHRRLAIIDLAGSPQPMIDDALTVTYNGEIYNFAELRAELTALGARFRTAGDTEVLLHGWRAWGPGLLDRLNGMFAFALYDGDARSLFLARDRLGVKPLYYVELSDGSGIEVARAAGKIASAKAHSTSKSARARGAAANEMCPTEVMDKIWARKSRGESCKLARGENADNSAIHNRKSATK